MILENTFRFKHTFAECKTYEDVFGMLKWVEDHFKTLKSLGVKKTGHGAEDDYHCLEIDTDDPKKIKQLKLMGFEEELEGRLLGRPFDIGKNKK